MLTLTLILLSINGVAYECTGQELLNGVYFMGVAPVIAKSISCVFKAVNLWGIYLY